MASYILTLLGKEQERLEETVKNSEDDPFPEMAAKANSIVGEAVIHEVYRTMGAEFISATMGKSIADVERMIGGENMRPNPTEDCLGKKSRVLN